VKYYYNLNKLFSSLMLFKMSFIPIMVKLYFFLNSEIIINSISVLWKSVLLRLF